MIQKFKSIQKPKRLECELESLTSTYGKFLAEPFERGFGLTVGNALRRILLSAIEGAAVTTVRIAGALHEFSTIPGVKEDATDIILNLKGLRFRLNVDHPKTLYLKVFSEGEVRAEHITPDPDVEILNPDLHIATLEQDGKLELELEVRQGRGYCPAERNKREGQPVDVIAIDSIFSPIRKDHLGIFTNFEEEPEGEGVVIDEAKKQLLDNLNRSVDELELSVRSANCL